MNRRQILSWSFFWLFSLNLLISSILPLDNLPSFLVVMDDKALHAFEHFLLFFFALAAFSSTDFKWLGRKPVALSYGYCLFMGALIEAEQMLVPYRQTEFGDWLADLAGTSVAWVCLMLFPFLRKMFLAPPSSRE